jgi:hypothetical protein
VIQFYFNWCVDIYKLYLHVFFLSRFKISEYQQPLVNLFSFFANKLIITALDKHLDKRIRYLTLVFMGSITFYTVTDISVPLRTYQISFYYYVLYYYLLILYFILFNYFGICDNSSTRVFM